MIKSFKLGGKSFVVEIVDHDSSELGRAMSPINTIQIQQKWEGKEIPLDSMEQTLYHELMHCIFTEIGRDDLSTNEVLTQSIALLLHQFEQTKKSVE